MELRFKTLEVDGFRTLRDVSLDLSIPGLHFVQGSRDGNTERSNGAGKSSLFASLMFTLYGFAISFSGRQLKRNDCIPGSARLSLEVNDLKIVREFSAKRSACFVNGQAIRSNDTRFIVERVCDPRVFASCVFLAPISVSREVVFGTAREKLQTITKLFGLEEFIVAFDQTWKSRLREYYDLQSELQDCYAFFQGQYSAIERELELQTRRSKLEQMESELQQLIQTKSQLESKLQRLEYALTLLRQSRVIPQWILQELEQKRLCPVCGSQVPEPQKIIAREKEKVELETRVNNELSQVRNELAVTVNKITSIQTSINQVRASTAATSKQLEKLSKTLHAVEEDLQAVRGFLEKTNYVDLKGLVKKFTQEFYKTVVSNTNEILHYFGLDFQVGVDEKLNLLIDEGGKMRSVDSASGGEQARLLLAFSLSILLTSRGSVRPSILVVDEALDILDLDGRRRVLELLRDIADRYKLSIFLISHHDLLSEFEAFDSVIHVRREGSCTKVSRTFLQNS